MSKSSKRQKYEYPAIQKAYKRGGFDAVWAWLKGRPAPIWFRAAAWANKRAKQSDDPVKFRKAYRAYHRRAKFLHKLHQQHQAQNGPDSGHIPSGAGFVIFDGERVPNWLARILQEARDDGVAFHVISGSRTPAESIGLCEGYCGQPTCTSPIACAGAGSNHNSESGEDGTGAVDIYPGAGPLEAWCRAHNKPLYGGGYALPNDPNHFSRTGR